MSTTPVAGRWSIISMSHVPLSAYVEALAHGRPWLDPDRIDAWLMHRCFAQSSFVAIDAQRPVGLALAIAESARTQTALYLDQVAVAASHRRQGLARALIGRCEQYARELGAQAMWLCTDPRNPAAFGWGRLGFIASDSRHTRDGWPVHKDLKGPGKDRVVFVKQWGATGFPGPAIAQAAGS